MSGLEKICKLYGSLKATDVNGKTIVWLWDYVNDKARLKTEMTKEEISASEKAKWANIAAEIPTMDEYAQAVKNLADKEDKLEFPN